MPPGECAASMTDPSSQPKKSRFRTVEGAIIAAIIVILAGLVVPTVRTWRFKTEESTARADLARIRDAILRFTADLGTTPTRGRDGRDRQLYRLIGPGLIPEGAYYYADGRQGFLTDHLVRNRPRGPAGPGYDPWHGPYLESLTSDPWGFAYFVVTYPLVLDDDRDCVVVSAGRNGVLDGNYASARDPVAVGDDLIELVVDKSPTETAPLR